MKKITIKNVVTPKEVWLENIFPISDKLLAHFKDCSDNGHSNYIYYSTDHNGNYVQSEIDVENLGEFLTADDDNFVEQRKELDKDLIKELTRFYKALNKAKIVNVLFF